MYCILRRLTFTSGPSREARRHASMHPPRRAVMILLEYFLHNSLMVLQVAAYSTFIPRLASALPCTLSRPAIDTQAPRKYAIADTICGLQNRTGGELSITQNLSSATLQHAPQSAARRHADLIFRPEIRSAVYTVAHR